MKEVAELEGSDRACHETLAAPVFRDTLSSIYHLRRLLSPHLVFMLPHRAIVLPCLILSYQVLHILFSYPESHLVLPFLVLYQYNLI